ncbi:MAG: ribosome maturation factor RimM [Anaerolineae bacterium]|jgi:16S rRNA processing protein RimM|nr:ribosome maturation factor RimM [Anaerolineae bacterium]
MAKPIEVNYLQLGDILRPHGVHGEVRVRVLTAYPERLPKLKRVYLGTSPTDPRPAPYTIAKVRFDRQYALVTFAEITDRDTADRLRGLCLMVALQDAVPLEDGEVYLFQMIGMRVVSEDGQDLGEIIDIAETGGNDNYIVKSPTVGEYAIPDIPQVIVRIDVPNRQLVIRPLEGLIPDKPPRQRKRHTADTDDE